MKYRDYLIFFIAGLVVAWVASSFQNTPGYMDAEYYYLGGRQLASGSGFIDPILWNYLDDPLGLPHPANAYWMPLASILAGFGQMLVGSENFSSARSGFFLLAALISPITLYLTYSLTGMRRAAIFAGLLALFPMFYQPFLTTTDTFAVIMVLGGLFLLAVGTLVPAQGPQYRLKALAPFLIGLLAGLMHLARADGLIWLICGVVGVVLAWRMPSPDTNNNRGSYPLLIRSTLLLVFGYLILMGPWFVRNLEVFGTPLSPGGTRALWMTEYNEIFNYPAETLSFSNWINTGILEILRVRLAAIGSNLTHTLVVQGQIFLAPLSLLGIWGLRRDLRVQIGLLVWLLTFIFMTFIFPFPGVRGGLFHSGASIQILIWATVPVGLYKLIDIGQKYRGWKPEQARAFFQAGLVLLAGTITLVIFYNRVIGGDYSQPAWDDPSVHYTQVERALVGEQAPAMGPILINNPVGYYLVAERPAVVIPNTGVETLKQVASRYGVKFLVLEQNHPDQLAGLYQEPGDLPGLLFLGSVESSHIFRIEN